MKKEIWKIIPGYETRYEASTLGRIKSVRRFVVINQRYGNNGYKWIRLFIDGKRKYHDVHRLIAKTFLENTNNLPCVSHEDNDKHNNYVNNLKWCSYKYNSQKSYADGLTPRPPSWKGKSGYEHNKSKEVHYFDENKDYVCSFGSMSEAGRCLNYCISSVSKAIKINNGKTPLGYFSLDKILAD